MLTIGLDIGTTGLCALLIDAESGAVLKTVTRANSFFIESTDTWEKTQDADKIFGCVKEMLDEIFCDGVTCIGVTGQMHGIVYLDKNGRLLSPLYTWQDGRGDLPYDGATYAKKLGAPSGYGLTTDFYNRVNGIVPENAAVICTVHDYTAMRLACASKPLVHSSDAASLGLFDIQKCSFTAANPLLPDVTGNVKIIGEYRGAAVCTAIGDNQAGFIGSVEGDGVLVNVGTGSQVSVYSEDFRTVKGLETRPLDGKACILVGSSLCGGRAFALLERFFASVVSLVTRDAVPSMYRQLDKLLEDADSTTLMFDTRFCGTRENPAVRAAVTNLGEDNFTAKDFALAVLYGMADELHDFFALSGASSGSVTGSGNGIRKNPALVRVLEKKFGCRLLVPAHREEAAYGAALCALYASGKYKSLAEAQGLIKFENGD